MPQGDPVLWNGFCSANAHAELPIMVKSGDRGLSDSASHGQREGSCYCALSGGALPVASHYRPLPPQMANAIPVPWPTLHWRPAHLCWSGVNSRASPIG